MPNIQSVFHEGFIINLKTDIFRNFSQFKTLMKTLRKDKRFPTTKMDTKEQKMRGLNENSINYTKIKLIAHIVHFLSIESVHQPFITTNESRFRDQIFNILVRIRVNKQEIGRESELSAVFC